MSHKVITLWITSNANETPGTNGYRVHVTDPDPGIDNARRTLASGFGVPIPCRVEDMLWTDGGTPLALQWQHKRGTVSAWPAFQSPPDNFKDRWVFKSIPRSLVPAY